jgi:hypothetical protein
MYSRSFREGDTINVYQLLEGITADGDTIKITMDDLHLHLWQYRDLVRDLMAGRQEPMGFVLGKIASDSPIVEFHVLTFPVVVTRAGPRDKPSERIAIIPVTGEAQ